MTTAENEGSIGRLIDKAEVQKAKRPTKAEQRERAGLRMEFLQEASGMLEGLESTTEADGFEVTTKISTPSATFPYKGTSYEVRLERERTIGTSVHYRNVEIVTRLVSKRDGEKEGKTIFRITEVTEVYTNLVGEGGERYEKPYRRPTLSQNGDGTSAKTPDFRAALGGLRQLRQRLQQPIS